MMYVFLKKIAEKHKILGSIWLTEDSRTETKKKPGRKGPVFVGAPYRTRTCDLLHVKQAL